jgi:hypothetical protein
VQRKRDGSDEESRDARAAGAAGAAGAADGGGSSASEYLRWSLTQTCASSCGCPRALRAPGSPPPPWARLVSMRAAGGRTQWAWGPLSFTNLKPGLG